MNWLSDVVFVDHMHRRTPASSLFHSINVSSAFPLQVFAFIFAAEAALKILGLGRAYFQVPFNWYAHLGEHAQPSLLWCLESVRTQGTAALHLVL